MGHRVAVLRDGRLQQVDTPGARSTTARSTPSSRRSSGRRRSRSSSPPSGRASRRVHGVDVPLDRAVAGRAGEQGRRGLRPSPGTSSGRPSSGPGATSLALNVELVESLGAESFVYGRPADADETADRVTVRLDKRTHLAGRGRRARRAEPWRGAPLRRRVGRADRGLRCRHAPVPGPPAGSTSRAIAEPGASSWRARSRFGAAYDAGVTGVELDVRLTADGEVVVWHDAVLLPEKCLPTGRDLVGARVADVTLEQLRTVDVGCRTLEGFPAQRRPRALASPRSPRSWPHGQERAPDVWWTIELKVDPRDAGESEAPRLLEGVLESVHAAGLESQCFVHSFDWAVLELSARARTRRAPLGARGDGDVGAGQPAGPAACVVGEPRHLCDGAAAVGAQVISPQHELVDEGLVERAHAAGLRRAAVDGQRPGAHGRARRACGWHGSSPTIPTGPSSRSLARRPSGPAQDPSPPRREGRTVGPRAPSGVPTAGPGAEALVHTGAGPVAPPRGKRSWVGTPEPHPLAGTAFQRTMICPKGTDVNRPAVRQHVACGGRPRHPATDRRGGGRPAARARATTRCR